MINDNGLDICTMDLAIKLKKQYKDYSSSDVVKSVNYYFYTEDQRAAWQRTVDLSVLMASCQIYMI